MIVTRRRPKRRNYGPILLPLLALAALTLALVWPPSRNVIANGPLKPVWNALAVLTQPITFTAQQGQLADRNREIRRLNDLLEGDRKAKQEQAGQVAALQSRINHLSAVPPSTPLPLATPLARASAGPETLGLGAAPVASDIHRTAAYWQAMDAEKAAAIVQRLPKDYVNRVFAQMTPDAVGDIMNALPARIAAQLAIVDPTPHP